MGVMKAYTIPVATFAALGTPHEWLTAHGWTSNFDVVEADDIDLDGMATWEEYIAGTIPTSSVSRFEIAQPIYGLSSVDITISTQTGRLYQIEYANSWSSNAWTQFTLQAAGAFTETSSVSSTHSFIDDFSPDTSGQSPTNGTRAYRIRVLCPDCPTP